MKVNNQTILTSGYKKTHTKQPKQANFRGWAACPLESVTIRPNHYREFNLLLLELQRKCGQYFNINVLFSDRLVKDINTLPLHKNQPLAQSTNNKWMQDYGIYLSEDKFMNIRYIETVKENFNPGYNIAQLAGVESKDSYLPFEGGNMFLGKKHDGEGYAIIGDKVICEMVEQILKRDPEYSVLINEGNKIIEIVKCALFVDPKYKGLIPKLRSRIADELQIKPKNLYCAKQSSFHIDMVIRPLDYPYVLVGDPNLTIELAKQKYANTHHMSHLQLMSKKTEKSSGETKQNNEAKSNAVDVSVQYLKSQGLIPIRVPGLLPEHYPGLNYMNAIVHQDTDGRFIYITNKNHYKAFLDIDFEEIFVDYVKSHVPSIKKVIFIDGNELIEALLQNQQGGIHCLSLEKPDFRKWKTMLSAQNSEHAP